MSLVDRSRLTDEQTAAFDKLADQLRLVALIKEQRGLEKRLGYSAGSAAAAAN